jgi:hypothetical protein
MPSLVLGQPLASGPQIVISGNPWSGFFASPQAGIQFVLDYTSSGAAYIGLSGGTTFTSGGMQLSGGVQSGLLDGMQIAPGGAYWLPRAAFPVSGTYNVWAWVDAAASGKARLYFEKF